MRKLHMMNEKKRNSWVTTNSLVYVSAYRLGSPGKQVAFRRYLAVGEGRTHQDLEERFAPDYAKEIVTSDPEIDMETVGRAISRTDVVYLSGQGEILYAPPHFVEVIMAPDGSEKERRDPQDVPANTDGEVPLRWSGKKIPKAKAVTQFVFARTIQLRHADGLTYDFLYAMAKELHEEQALVLVGAGKGGKEPLIFQTNGRPYRGFLEGRVDADKYMLLLQLSNMELKRPA